MFAIFVILLSRRWYTAAAENGMGAAQNELSKFLFNGVGYRPDLEKAA
jgi:TPR repeat protein